MTMFHFSPRTVGLVTVIAILLVFKIWRLVKQMRSTAKTVTPPRIHLSNAPDVQWEDSEALADIREKVIALHFHQLATFTIDEMPGLLLIAFAKPSESTYCIVYQHPHAGMWIEMVTQYDDGTGLIVSNNPHGNAMEPRPGQKKINMRPAGIHALYSRMAEEREYKPLKLLNGTVEEFVCTFQKSYADEMDWRNSRGGATADEIRLVAQNSGRQVNDTMIKMAQAIRNKQACEGLIVAFEEKLMEKRQYADTEWKDLRTRLLFVHDRLPLDVVRRMVKSHLPGSRVPKELPDGSSVRDVFAWLNEQVAVEKRLAWLTMLDDPLPVDVYLLPARDRAAV